jgi:hypothetical protein
MRKLLKILGYTWLAIAGLVIIAGYIGVAINQGFGALLEMLSPYNVIGWATVVATLAPGLGLLWLRERLARKQREARS